MRLRSFKEFEGIKESERAKLGRPPFTFAKATLFEPCTFSVPSKKSVPMTMKRQSEPTKRD